MADFLPLCQEAARVGGDVLRRYAGKIRYREKGKHDLVTEADIAAQQAIREVLERHCPGFDFLGEEDDDALQAAGLEARAPYRWLVDPLDGTANYVHGLNGYAVSIALEHEGSIICGVVFDPMSGECYSAERGKGATLNGETLRTSGCTSMDEAMIAASFSPNVARDSIEITRFVEILHRCQSIRRLGSAALNLCYIAAGRLDGYWATSVKIWDIAAGMVILEEAGGTITNLAGEPLRLARPELAASATQALHAEFLQALAAAG